MNSRSPKFTLLATLLLLATSAWAQLPCGVVNQIVCQPWDGGSNLFASRMTLSMASATSPLLMPSLALPGLGTLKPSTE